MQKALLSPRKHRKEKDNGLTLSLFLEDFFSIFPTTSSAMKVSESLSHCTLNVRLWVIKEEGVMRGRSSFSAMMVGLSGSARRPRDCGGTVLNTKTVTEACVRLRLPSNLGPKADRDMQKTGVLPSSDARANQSRGDN